MTTTINTTTFPDELEMPSRNLNYEKVVNDISKWIGDEAIKAGNKGLVVGVSGGVDSAVVSTLCAMSGQALTVLELPIHQAPDQVSRSAEHIAWLKENFSNVTSHIMDLSKTFDTFQEIQLPGDDIESEDLADANLRSRIRMCQLYSTANRKSNSLVIGTGNKVEDAGVRFFTKYGDGGVDYSPIAELFKSEVRNASKYMGHDKKTYEAIATDGLWTTGVTDEDQIGCTYPQLEWAMVEYAKGKRAQDFDNKAKEVMEIFTSRHEGGAHKMKMPPVFEIDSTHMKNK
ncbi:NAD(+) synthase [Candidatus Gracilibacteria bacterium]|nr:NAD(+) synthase [Candidatus Gracilibacteria bacterium]